VSSAAEDEVTAQVVPGTLVRPDLHADRATDLVKGSLVDLLVTGCPEGPSDAVPPSLETSVRDPSETKFADVWGRLPKESGANFGSVKGCTADRMGTREVPVKIIRCVACRSLLPVAFWVWLHVAGERAATRREEPKGAIGSTSLAGIF